MAAIVASDELLSDEEFKKTFEALRKQIQEVCPNMHKHVSEFSKALDKEHELIDVCNDYVARRVKYERKSNHYCIYMYIF